MPDIVKDGMFILFKSSLQKTSVFKIKLKTSQLADHLPINQNALIFSLRTDHDFLDYIGLPL